MTDKIISGTNRLPEKMIDVNGDESFFARLTTTQTSQLQTTSDLTKTIVASTTTTTTPIITATAAVRGRVYRLRIDVAGANVLTFTDASGTEEMNFTGAGFRIYDFVTRPWFMTALNTAFSVTTTTTAKVNIVCEYTKAA